MKEDKGISRRDIIAGFAGMGVGESFRLIGKFEEGNPDDISTKIEKIARLLEIPEENINNLIESTKKLPCEIVAKYPKGSIKIVSNGKGYNLFYYQDKEKFEHLGSKNSQDLQI